MLFLLVSMIHKYGNCAWNTGSGGRGGGHGNTPIKPIGPIAPQSFDGKISDRDSPESAIDVLKAPSVHDDIFFFTRRRPNEVPRQVCEGPRHVTTAP